MSDVIGQGSKVKMHLRITLENGTVAEETFGAEPLEFTVGDGTMVPGLEQMLIGLPGGEKASFTVHPEDAFGERDPEKIQVMERTEFPLEMSQALQPGQIIAFHAPSGEDVLGTVVDMTMDRVEMDFNHPLAGRTVKMDVEILSVESGAGE